MFRERLVVLQRNTTMLRLLELAIFVGLLGAGAMEFLHVNLGGLGLYLAFAATIMRVGAARHNALARPRECTVEASAAGLVVDGEAIPRRELVDGYFQPRARTMPQYQLRAIGSTVQLFGRWKRMVFQAEVGDPKQASLLLHALGLSASQKRAEFRGTSWASSTQGRASLLAGVACGLIALLAIACGWLNIFGLVLLPCAIVFVVMALIAFAPSRITIGVDGVLMRWLWMRRFIPMARIATIEAEELTEIRLTLDDDKVETIHTSVAKAAGDLAVDKRDLILARMREAWHAARTTDAGADVTSLVARGTRTFAEWREALVSLRKNESAYRHVEIRDEDLWRVVEDPQAAADARAGAARLLRTSLDAEGRARVRVAAEATALPKLRIALAAMAEDEEEAADEALAALAADEPA